MRECVWVLGSQKTTSVAAVPNSQVSMDGCSLALILLA